METGLVSQILVMANRTQVVDNIQHNIRVNGSSSITELQRIAILM
jgi:hypothetical protein